MNTIPELRQQALDILRRTHHIFCGIKGKDIALIAANPPGRTDCESFISLPIEDPEADIIHKHEWQHIFFKSNMRARQAFVEAYMQQLLQRMPSYELRSYDVASFLHFFINALDDLRVCSLWELIYPGSAREIQERWRSIILQTKRYKKDIVLYTMGLGLGLRFPDEERVDWRRYESLLLDATQKVMGRGFPSCLIAARIVFDTILEDVSLLSQGPAFTPPPPVPLQQLAPPAGARLGGPRINRDPPQADQKAQEAQAETFIKLVSQASSKTREEMAVGRESWKMMDTDKLPAGPDPDWKGTQAIAQAALGVSSADQVNYLLDQSQMDIEHILEALRAYSHSRLTPDQQMLQGFESHVVFKDVKPYMVADLPLHVQDRRLVQTMRQGFLKLMDRKSRVRTEAGTELDPEFFIDMVYGDGDSAIFREETSSKGFSALVLIDMSGSMKEKWTAVSRACKVLAKSMKFPFSQFEVWGFSSDHEGKTSILRFEDTERGYWGAGLKDIWGLTPLHIVSEVGIRRLQLLPGTTKHLFILTDGYPTHVGLRSGSMPSTSKLMLQVAKNVHMGRRKSVNTAGLVIGWSVLDESANAMFGPGRWSRLDAEDEDLFQGMVGLIQKAFTVYLRRR
jgi:hypothetical protein